MAGIPFSNIYPDGPGSEAAGGLAAVDAGNPQYPGMPAGASPIEKDQTYTAAGTYTLWAPSSGMKFVLAKALISTDTAGRVALVDGADIPGSRPVDGTWGANGGVSDNGVPVPYVSRTVGNPLLAVVVPVGVVKVSVRGWEQPG